MPALSVKPNAREARDPCQARRDPDQAHDARQPLACKARCSHQCHHPRTVRTARKAREACESEIPVTPEICVNRNPTPG